MTTTSIRFRLNASCAVLPAAFVLLAFGATPAAAQSREAAAHAASQGEGAIQDIVVTAQRRDERLQDVPIAVTAIGGDQLEARGINSASDLNMQTPNLNVVRSVKTQLVYLRGIGNNSTSPGQEQNVAVYVDGVYYPSMAANVFSFNNLERIEVLRGPQGTLFGRNTTGGLVQVVTKNPTQEPSGDFTVGYGRFNTIEATGYLASGITDNLRADVAVQWHDQQDGWGKNLITGKDVYLSNEISVRSKIIFEPTETSKITLFGMYFKSNADFGTARTVRPCAERIGQSCVPIQPGLPTFNNLPYTGFYNTQADFPSNDRTTLYTGSLRFEQDLGFGRLVNISAYQRTQNNESLDSDATQGFISRSIWTDVTRSFSNETQIQSQPSSPVSWIAGFYYFWANGKNTPLRQVSPTTDSSSFATTRTNSVSFFGQVTVALGERTKLTGGARYTIDKKDIVARTVNNLTNAQTLIPRQASTFSSPTFRVAIDHKLNDDALLYASVSTGFKSGLYNVSAPSQPAARPEKLTSYEVGTKLDLLDKHLRVNAAAFYYDYKDIQVIGYDGLVTTLQNAASAELYGVEFDVTAQVTRQLSLRSSMGYLHSKYKSFPAAQSNSIVNPTTGVATGVPAPGLNLTGFTMPRAPKFTVNAGLDYEVPISFGKLMFSGTYYYNHGFNWDADSRLKQKSYDVVNASVTWTSDSDHYSVKLWVNNAFSTKYAVATQSGNNRIDLEAPAAPATYGITAGYKF